MLDADIVVAAAGARFKLPEASLGVFVTGGLSATLPAAAGLMRAKALTLLGDTFSAEQAQAWGLVCRVLAADSLDEASDQVATHLASLRPEVAERFKHVLNTIGLPAFDRAIELENQTQRAFASAPPPH